MESLQKQKELQAFADIQRRHGLDKSAFLGLLHRADYRCECCGKPLFFRHKNHDLRPQIDHCHRSSKVRGILCRSCNLMIGHAFDSTRILQRAINYLNTNSNAVYD